MVGPNETVIANPDILRNYTTQAANPNPLEIYPVFLQPKDDPAAYATVR